MESDIIDAILSSTDQTALAITYTTTTAINLLNDHCSSSLAVLFDNIREYLISINMESIFTILGPVFFSSIFGVRFGYNLIDRMRIKYAQRFEKVSSNNLVVSSI